MQPNFPIPFTKMSGTGNDFILIDHRTPMLAGLDVAAFARAVCRRRFSVGADGLILIEPSVTADFAWRFFNADGSIAEMCGNGARCAARFAFTKGIAPAAMRFETLAGVIAAQVTESGERPASVKLRMTTPTAVVLNQPLMVDGTTKTIHAINTGVPHAVHFVDDLAATPVFAWGRLLRDHPEFQPAGANVNFVQTLGPASLKVRTYERGVENETMACGTGAVAAALVSALLGQAVSPVAVTTSGGDRLLVHFRLIPEDTPTVTEVFLEGPAHFVYEGQLGKESLP
ncbi:MAG: diaminopimelate epimerase [Deltaproteobacteria bacterium CG_4_10_14_3_um_filter_60_8]|nr:MAG: diaminopimelate epimerase [Desulfobacterales bacterium CG2_30_60_27]PIP43522.1 MAG: diaminopimelate epimerase [Deltaproteobacteria bacterium CG23_combo_of_CG06-09_8_20_14_all_60_8]PIY24748.1 MAG: diaminopimelate epimerase [Deltaproteobacteria bacterium CG_4_10_14_3_um_filter_60_8]